MDLPFTTEQFLASFETYNTAVFPMQVILNLIAFTVVLTLSVWGGQNDHCGCGLWEMPPRWALIRNLALTLLHMWLLVIARHNRKIGIFGP